ncbi:hypothetical protein K505DRAFT_382413 [Melanomma pulvis-pyrius CBS 109.77]|uniref:Uncharacterized protein n=1 Tax=Melanomma pulvis-pyrius CBS 109.77 TaxID=1314802 RepID=A0A6A6XFT8_9PLEO|nr:hypothetical protein K505DRAFT_382413 [Melanomma pulvis-pyrius CBS 109.77]
MSTPPVLLTPTRRVLPNTNAPGSHPGSSMRNSVMGCSADPDVFSDVLIHTAKCSNCDERNMGTMRRCPGCTWQICEKCIKLREAKGKRFEHGNMASPGTSMSTPPRRRIPFNPGASTPTPGGSVLKQEVTSPAAGVQQQSATPKTHPTSGKRGRGAKGKAKAPVISDDEFDDDFKKSASPTPKRRKIGKESSPVEEPTTERRPTRGQASTRAPAGSRTSPLPMSGADVARPNPQPSTDAPIDRRRSDRTIPNLIHDVVGKPRWQEHFLGRTVPNMNFIPDVITPTSVLRGFRPPPTAETMQKTIHEKCESMLQGAQEHSSDSLIQEPENQSAVVVASEAPDQPEPSTVLDFATAEYEKRLHGVDLDDDQQQSLKQFMKEAARKFATKIYNEQSQFVRNLMKPGLQMPFGAFTEPQKKGLTDTIKDEADRILKDFEEEASVHTRVFSSANASPGATLPSSLTGPGSDEVSRMSPRTDSDISARAGAPGTPGSENAAVEDMERSHSHSHRS